MSKQMNKNLRLIIFIIILSCLGRISLHSQFYDDLSFKVSKMIKKHKYEKALKYLNNKIENDSNKASAYFFRGLVKYKIQQPDEGCKDIHLYAVKNRDICWDEIVNCDSIIADYYLIFIKRNTNTDNLDEAMNYANEALDIIHSISDLFLKRGEIYLKLKDFYKAKEDLEKSIEIDSNNADAYNSLAIVYYELNMNDKISICLAKYDKLSKNFKSKSYKLNYILHLKAKDCMINKNYDEALQHYNDLIKFNDSKPEYYGYRGDYYYEIGKFEEGIADFNKAIDNDPVDFYYHVKLGMIYYQLMDYENALSNFDYVKNTYLRYKKKDINFVWIGDTGYSINENTYQLYYFSGLIYFNQKNYAKAINDLLNAIEYNVMNSYSYYVLGLAYYESNETENACKYLKKSIDNGFVVAKDKYNEICK